jgi:hypothetical protein
VRKASGHRQGAQEPLLGTVLLGFLAGAGDQEDEGEER